MNLLLILALLALAASWIFFALFSARHRGRMQAALGKFEDARHRLREEVGGVNLIIELLDSIHEFSFEDAEEDPRAALSRMIVDAACKLMRCPNGSLMLLDKETGELTVSSGQGATANAFTTHLRLGEGVAGLVAESGKMIRVDDIDADVRFMKKKDSDYRLKSMVAVPLRVRNRVIGVLNISAPEPHHDFDERHVRLLAVLADQSAITLENLESYRNLQTFYLEMIETMARTLELKENVTRDALNYRRMRLYAREISRELSLPESIIRHVEFAALISGIGKIGVDDSILRKPGKLTEDEYAQVKKHPEIGKKIIAQVRFLSPVTPMVLYHQERWDGKGYPAGLRGEEIPLGSRIVAVVNAYHAMTSDRPYRKALDENEVLGELYKGSGNQFDPKVVEAFVRVLGRLKEAPGEPAVEPA